MIRLRETIEVPRPIDEVFPYASNFGNATQWDPGGTLTAIVEMLPKLLEKFSSIENKVSKVVTDIGEVTSEIKEHPSLLLRAPKEKVAPVAKSVPGHR